jgi:hypothetical protein
VAPVKKGRHRRFEEARALKRSQNIDFEGLLDSLNTDDDEADKPEHAAWDDLAEKYGYDDEDEDGPSAESA